jgi:hypothetical protein
MNDECDIPCINNESEADGSLLSSSLSQSSFNSQKRQQQQQEEVGKEVDNEVDVQQNYQDNRRSLLPRPNSSLTEEERKHKQNLKKEMKRKRYEERLERRYRHALVRKDPIVAKETKNTLESIWSQRMTTKTTMTTDLLYQNTINSHEHSARQFIESMYHDLQQQQQQQLNSSSCTTGTIRDIQTFEGVSLLQHMTKGTQSKTMFANVHALWGYTRQKFQSRAMLVYTSLVQVGTRYDDWMYESSSSSTMTCPKQEEEISLRIKKKEMTWEYITTSIQSIVSIGCGPGCDALGVLAFLREHGVQSSSSLDQSKEASTVTTSPPLLQSICLMDYAMDEWYPAILSHLIPLWIPTWVGNVDYTLGDVTKSWMDDDKDVNDTFRDMVTRIQPDLYIFSYLLTETRGQWETFLHDVVTQIMPMKTRLLFAEPTPWQLHRLLLVFPELDYLWLDSSHSLSTELQNMKGRLGPAVLMAWKREKK